MNLTNKDFLNDLYLFYRLFITSNYAENVPAPHIKILAKKLMNLSLGVDKNRLCVSMPPRHSKSSMVTLAYPLWLFLQDPSLNIMIVTGSKSLAEKFGIQLREQFKKLGKYFDIFLSDVKYSNTHLMFCNKENELYPGNLMLFTSGGGITGNDADYLILDDPYKGDDKEFTPSALQKKIDWVNRVIEQRIEPHTKYCVLHTRWHSKDLIGNYMVTAPDSYDFITFPALDENNVPLWKERYTKEQLLFKKEQVGERVFKSVYQQQPIDMTSDFFHVDNIHFNLPAQFNVNAKSCRAWDIASAKELSDNDFTAGAKMYKINDCVVVTDLVHGRFGNDTKNIIRNTAGKDGVDTRVVIETGVAAAGDFLFDEWKEQLKGFNLERAKVPGIKTKADRATPLKNAVEDGKVYISIDNQDARKSLISEFKTFPNGEHDDIIDAVAHGYNYLFDTNNRNVMLGVVNL